MVKILRLTAAGACGLAATASLLAQTPTRSAPPASPAQPAIRQGEVAPAAKDNRPLPTDPRLVTGELENGLRYIVLQHPNPPGRVNIWLHVSTGSLNETDKQRGVAHYLEHMAFNGSENFPPGSLVRFFESIGLTFGQHQNAFTSFDQTTYMLSLPDATPESIDKGLLFFGDVAGRLLLTEQEIEEERQVILEEKRSRSGAQQRVAEYVLERLFPGSLIGQRLPIGVEETLLAVQRPDFVEYYSRYYVPSNMTLMIVADADPQPIVAAIERHMSFGERTPRPQDQDPRVTLPAEDRAVVATDPELTVADITISRIEPAQPPRRTVGDYRRDLIERLGQQAFNRRLGIKIERGGTAYQSASATSSDWFNAVRLSQVSAQGAPETWDELLTELGTDLRRALLHGFTQRELEDAKTAVLSAAEEAVQREPTRPAEQLLRFKLNAAVAADEPIMSAEQELGLLRELLPAIEPEEVNAAFRRVFDDRNVTFVAELPSSVQDAPSPEALVRMGREALSVSPEPEAERERPTRLMEKLPEPGTITERAHHEPTGITSAWIDNGVRMHHRAMDIEKDSVTVVITLAAGNILETPENRGVADAAGVAWGRPATARLTSTDVRDLMLGKKVRVGGGTSLDTMTLTVSGTPGDLEHGMQLAHLLLTEPKVEPAAFEHWRTSTLQEIEGRDKHPTAALPAALAETIYPPTDPRTQPLTAEQVARVTPEAAQSWLDQVVATAPIEVTVVGDIPEARAAELVARYVGSLPGRERISDKTLADRRALKRRTGPILTERTLETATDQAWVLGGFYGADIQNLKDARALEMAMRIVDTRMHELLREKERLAYSPFARHRPATAFPGFGTAFGGSTTDPAKIEQFATLLQELYDRFAAEGPTADEMATAKRQTANALDEEMKRPSWWTGRTATLAYRGLSPDDIVSAPAAYEAFTADQIRDTFRSYYRPETSFRVVVRPAAAAGDQEEAPAETSETAPAGQ